MGGAPVALRTTPELIEYLVARRSLPTAELRVIGDEKSLFEFYLLNDGSLHGCPSRAFARHTVGTKIGPVATYLDLESRVGSPQQVVGACRGLPGNTKPEVR
jgi:hypothetical protein